jgi:alpha-mannosidase
VPPGAPHPGYTDQTDHIFRYALYPHLGGPVEGGVIRAGYEFNFPLRVVETDPHTGEQPAAETYVQVDADTILIEAIKKAEDGQDWIVRLYEAGGGAARTRLSFALPVQQVIEADLMEEPLGFPLAQDGNTVTLSFQPFEIKTLRVRLTN